jgi:hypothetical protein
VRAARLKRQLAHTPPPACACPQVALLKRQLAIPEGLPPPLAQLLAACLAPAARERPAFPHAVEVLAQYLQLTARASDADMTLPCVSTGALPTKDG